MVIHEYEVDTGLLRELREYSRQAAQEMGEWVSKHEAVTDYDGQYDDWTEEEILWFAKNPSGFRADFRITSLRYLPERRDFGPRMDYGEPQCW